MNSFGNHWTFTSFGESHGVAIGGVLDGVPSGLVIHLDLIRDALDRRAGKHQVGASPRAVHEPDEIEWLSGLIPSEQNPKQLISLGTPIAFLIRNKDARPEDYEWLKHTYREGHADKTYELKYGIRDWRGGGRASARETASRVVAGSIAQQQLAQRGISIRATLIQVGAETNPNAFADTIASYQRNGDSIGGIIECRIDGIPAGVGEPIFDKLQARLAFAILSINACKGFEYGTGFQGISQPGSAINHISGGISGGISDGTPITFRSVFKPTPTTPKSLSKLKNQLIDPSQLIDTPQLSDHLAAQSHAPMANRSDACVAVRAVPVVEAMTALTLIDLLQEL